jgi:hypothetical protein
MMFVFIARVPRLKLSKFCHICNKVVRSWAIAPRHVQELIGKRVRSC